VLLAVLLLMVLTADTHIASATSGGARPGLPLSGSTSWGSSLDFDPVRPLWAGRRAKRGGGATVSRALPPRRPLSASLSATAYEIDAGPAP
jgi:hypothetical protein